MYLYTMLLDLQPHIVQNKLHAFMRLDLAGLQLVQDVRHYVQAFCYRKYGVVLSPR